MPLLDKLDNWTRLGLSIILIISFIITLLEFAPQYIEGLFTNNPSKSVNATTGWLIDEIIGSIWLILLIIIFGIIGFRKTAKFLRERLPW